MFDPLSKGGHMFLRQCLEKSYAGLGESVRSADLDTKNETFRYVPLIDDIRQGTR
jgi:hypothetical protein